MPVAYKTSVVDNAANAASSSQLAFITPGTVVDGDFLLVALSVAGGAGTTVTLPIGWTQLLRSDVTTTISLVVAYRFASGEPATEVFTFGASGTHAGALAAYTGVDSFFPVDASATSQNASSTSQASPSITVTAQAAVTVLAFAAASNPTFTVPSGYTDRAHKSQTSASIELCDGGASTGTIASVSATLSGANVGTSCAIALRSAIGQTSVEQARSALKAHFPPGANDWYDWDNSTDPSELWKLTQAIASFLKYWGYDYADLIKQEVNPLTVVAKLAEWEGALGITQSSASAVNKWIATRQTAILSKLRESGASTLAYIRGVLEPLLGYTGANIGTLQIIETNRASLTTAHTYSNATGASIGANSNVSQTVYVSDDGGVSAAGVQVTVTITSTNPEQLSFTLTGPVVNGQPSVGSGQASITWAAAALPKGSVTSTAFNLYEHATSAGKYITGNWTLQINTGAATCTLVSWSLFTEGGGLRDANGGSGLGGAMFEWGVFADPAKTNAPDLVGVLNAIRRIQPGYSKGYLLLSIAGAYPDTTSGVNASIPDEFLPA